MTMTLKKNIKIDVSNIEYILIYISMDAGGIETLIVDLCCNLKGKTILIAPKGNLDFYIPDEIIRYYDLNISNQICFQTKLNINLITFDPVSTFYGAQLYLNNYKKNNISLFSGVFHPRAYFYNNKNNFLNNLILNTLGQKRVYFMSDDVYNSHTEKFNLNFTSPLINYLPIEVDNSRHRKAKVYNQIRILSIGRYDPFKKYNYGAQKILNQLLNSGIDVHWDFYGHGIDHPNLKELLHKNNLNKRINYYNEIEYKKINTIINNYDIFIGMGKTALQISLTGIPVICAIDNNELNSYGFMHELPTGNVGEVIFNKKLLNIFDLIIVINNLTQDNLIKFKELSVRDIREKYYTIDKYIKFFENNNSSFTKLDIFKLNIFTYFYSLFNLNNFIIKFKYIIKIFL